MHTELLRLHLDLIIWCVQYCIVSALNVLDSRKHWIGMREGAPLLKR